MPANLEGYKNEILLMEQGEGEDNRNFVRRINKVRDLSEVCDIHAFGSKVVNGVERYYIVMEVGTFSK